MIDLRHDHKEIIQNILKKHIPNEKVWAFGSRVKWTAKDNSDLDLAIISNKKVPHKVMTLLNLDFEESDLLFKVDILDWQSISDEFRKLIKEEHVVFVEKERALPDGWQKVKLGDVVKFNYGKSLPERKRIEGNVPVYSSAGLIDWHNEALIDSGGIIIGRKGTAGSVYTSSAPFFPIDTTFYITEKDTECDLKYLFYSLSKLRLDTLNFDSAVPGLNRNVAYAQSFFLPPLPEQKAIAEVLSSLDDKIDLLHRQNKTLEDMAQTLFRKWFIEDADERWEEVFLSDVYNFIKGCEPGSKVYKDIQTQKDIRFIRVGDMLNGYGKTYIPLNKASAICKENDLLVSFDGTVGRAVFGISGAYSSGIRKIKSDNNTYDNLGFKYLLFDTKLIQDKIQEHATGTVILHASSSIKFLSMPLPDEKVIYQFNESVESHFEKILSNQRQICTLEKLCDRLLPKMISGKIRLKITNTEKDVTMEQHKHKLKVFLSYAHDDEKYIKEFKKHIKSLERENKIECWHDRNMTAGSNIEDTLDHKIRESDIFCLFISSNFIASDACQNEKQQILSLENKPNDNVIPIILSHCPWEDDSSISHLLALPEDGKPIGSFPDSNKAWLNVYRGIKKVADDIIGNRLEAIEIRQEFLDFLQNVELFVKAHSQKEQVILDDIFVNPNLSKYDDTNEYDKSICFSDLLNNLVKYPRLLIAGENQSGKTTLCKKLFLKLRAESLIPVYIGSEERKLTGKINNRINEALKKQYDGSIVGLDKQYVVPIIDDFHLTGDLEKKKKQLRDLSDYPRVIIVTDDIFSLNIKDKRLVESFAHFSVNEFSPSLRNKLIRKWIGLSDSHNHIISNNSLGCNSDNDFYKRLDATADLIEASLGRGIVPAYPFFILSIVSFYETSNPIDKNITSQGYCYQALIYFCLIKQGVQNEEFDAYLNFLTHLAFYLFDKRKVMITEFELEEFIKEYLIEYNFPIKMNVLLKKLIGALMLRKDSFNNYSFYYNYIYYFFVGRYLSRNTDSTESKINNIVKNLHKDEHAYIAIFTSHHSESNYVLELITSQARHIFDMCQPASLSKNEVDFLDQQSDLIVKASSERINLVTPEQERARRLEEADAIEELDKEIEQNTNDRDNEEIVIEMRRSIKTVEVMGHIIKNRFGSLRREQLEKTFEEAMDIILRLLKLFLDPVGRQNKTEQQETIQYISERLAKIIEKKDEHKLNRGDLEKWARKLYWNLIFSFVFILIGKIIHTLGSDKLIEITQEVCKGRNTPASFIVQHGILMRCKKNLNTEEVLAKIRGDNLETNDEFSKTAKEILKYLVVDHCLTHDINHKDRQKIAQALGTEPRRLLTRVNN